MKDHNAPDPGRPDTITLAEAAKRLGKSVKATKRAVERGELPAIRWGRSYLILRVPFERMLGLRPDPERPS